MSRSTVNTMSGKASFASRHHFCSEPRTSVPTTSGLTRSDTCVWKSGEKNSKTASSLPLAIYEFFSPDFHSHVSERITPEVIGTDIRGSEQKWWREAKEAFPDMVFTVDLLIEQDDLIVSNWSVKGTHTGAPFNGIAPTGKPVHINGTAILRMRDGQIVEHWGGPHCQDGYGLTHT